MVHSTVLPDLVYPLRVEEDSEELRYSLRSVCANADGLFGRVWVVGDRPDWLTGVGFLDAALPPGRPGDPWGPIRDRRFKAASVAAHGDVAETLLWMNDDFFLCRPISSWQMWHQGDAFAFALKMRAAAAPQWWLHMVESMALWAQRQGVQDGKAWQGHLPRLFAKARLGEAIAAYPESWPLDVCGLYELAGAIGGPGERGVNTKVHNAEQFRRGVDRLDRVPWLSTTDVSFRKGIVGEYIRELFPDPCRFEVA